MSIYTNEYHCNERAKQCRTDKCRQVVDAKSFINQMALKRLKYDREMTWSWLTRAARLKSKLDLNDIWSLVMTAAMRQKIIKLCSVIDMTIRDTSEIKSNVTTILQQLHARNSNIQSVPITVIGWWTIVYIVINWNLNEKPSTIVLVGSER